MAILEMSREATSALRTEDGYDIMRALYRLEMLMLESLTILILVFTTTIASPDPFWFSVRSR